MLNWTKYFVQFVSLFLTFEALSQDLLPARKNKLWGYIDTSGNWVVQPIFDLVSPLENKEFAKVFAQGQIGLVSKSGQIVFKKEFQKVVLLNDSVLAFTNGHAWGLATIDGQVLVEEGFDYFYNFGKTGLIVVQKGKLYGLCNQQGQMVLPTMFEHVTVVNGDLEAISAQRDGQYELYARSGELLLPKREGQIMEADTNFFVIKEDKLLGAIDSSENNLVPFRYTSFRNLGFGFSLWESKSNNHLFSKNLNKMIYQDAQEYFVYNPTRIRIKKDEKYGVISHEGEPIILPNYQSIGTNGIYYKLLSDGLTGLSNADGEILVPIAYDYVAYPQDSLIPVSIQKKWGLYFENVGIIVDTLYDRLNLIERQVKAGNKSGVAIIDIGTNGRIISKEVYEQVYFFKITGNARYGFASDTVKSLNQAKPSFYFQDPESKLWGLRNPKGELVTRPIFTKVTHFSSGYTIGYIKGGTGRAFSTGQLQLGIPNYMALIDDNNYKMMTPPNLIYIDVDDLMDSSRRIVRIMAGPSRFSTINKVSYKIKQYNASWMDPISVAGYTRIYVGGVLYNSFKDETFKIGTVQSLARDYGFTIPNSKMSNNTLNSEVVCKGGYWNYIDTEGNYLVDAKSIPERERFKEAFAFDKKTAIVIVNNKWGVINQNGKYITQPQYDHISRIQGTDLLVLSLHQMAYGFADQFGNIIGQLDYDKIEDFSHGKAWVLKNEKWQLLSNDGLLVANDEVIRFKPYKNGWAPIRTVDKFWGYWNGNETTWKIAKFQALGAFHDDIAKYKQYGKWGYLNSNGIKLIEPTYAAVGDFENGFAWVKSKNGKMAIINADLKVITHFKYYKIGKYDQAQQVIVKKRKFGLVDNEGKLLLGCNYKNVGDLHEQRRIAQKMRMIVILNEQGKLVKKVKNIKQANDFNDGLCLVKRGRHFGYLDTNGNWALPPQYNGATDFSSGVALVGSPNSRSIINRFGDTITVTTIKARFGYKNGVTIATSRTNHMQYLADIYGNCESNSHYYKIMPFRLNDVAITVDAEERLGLLHFSGIEMLPTVFTHISEPKENVSKVLLNQKKTIINNAGKLIVEPGYFDIIPLANMQMIQINGFGASYGYLRNDGSWIYKEFE